MFLYFCPSAKPRSLWFLSLEICPRWLIWYPAFTSAFWWFCLQIGSLEWVGVNAALCPWIPLLFLAGCWRVVPRSLPGFVFGTFGEVPKLKQGNPETVVRKESLDFLSREAYLTLVRRCVSWGGEISPCNLASEKTAFWVLQSPLQAFFETFLFFVWISRLNESGFKDDYERAMGKMCSQWKKTKAKWMLKPFLKQNRNRAFEPLSKDNKNILMIYTRCVFPQPALRTRVPALRHACRRCTPISLSLKDEPLIDFFLFIPVFSLFLFFFFSHHFFFNISKLAV